MESAGIKWYSLRYHKRFSILSTAFDILRGAFLGLRLIYQNNIEIIHARSYVAALIGVGLKKISKKKLIFDMRGFWADERVDGGIWKKKSYLFKISKWFEKIFLLQSDHVVSLTRAAIEEINKFPYLKSHSIKFSVIPTCVDMDKFYNFGNLKKNFILGYVGSIGVWYEFEEVLKAFQVLLKIKPNAELLIVNRNEHRLILEMISDLKLSQQSVTLVSVEHKRVPEMMSRMSAGIFFIKPLYSKQASAPTKLGEFLACGIPCLVNHGVGDMTNIVQQNNVGTAINNFESCTLTEGIEELIKLVEDDSISERCRVVAKTEFSLEQGVIDYSKIYDSLGSSLM